MKPEIKVEDGITCHIKFSDLPIARKEKIEGLMDYYAPTIRIFWADNGEIVKIEIA